MFQELKERAGEVFAFKETKAERAALAPLQEYLDRHYTTLKMARVICKVMEGAFNLDHEQMAMLQDHIQEESKGEVRWWRASLCEIWEDGEEFQHESSHIVGEVARGAAFVRGFWFPFKAGGFHFECVDLDGGDSRKYFDLKTGQEKRRFMKRFAYRHLAEKDILPREAELGFVDRSKTPSGFVVFISDTGSGYVVGHIIARWPLRTRWV